MLWAYGGGQMTQLNQFYCRFLLLLNCSRENYLLIYDNKQFEKHIMVNDDRLLMHMCMSNSSKEGIVHVHAHPIIFYTCSAHVQCVKVLEQTCLSSWMRAK